VALEAVADDDADVLAATVLDLGHHAERGLRALAVVTDPDPEDVAFPVHGDAEGDTERRVPHLPVANRHHECVDEDDRKTSSTRRTHRRSRTRTTLSASSTPKLRPPIASGSTGRPSVPSP